MSMMVSFLSLAEGSVRPAITPGTEQPKPISRGTMLLPESPSFLKGLSITKATLAIYPVSSRSDRKKNNSIMIGRKLKTLPTPVNIPSITKDRITSLTFQLSKQASILSVRNPIPDSKRSCNHAPITLKVSQNMIPMIPINAGIAVYLPVRKASNFSLLCLSLLSLGLTTDAATSFFIKEKRISAIAADLSIPRSSSI